MPTIITDGAASAQGYGFAARTAAANYIEDVFSTYLYTGNGSTQTITNGIDLSTKGGLVWIKDRSFASNHRLFDTSNGVNQSLLSNLTLGLQATPNSLTAFNSNGFSLGNAAAANVASTNYASWTFRKQVKFFDVVTWTGNGGTSGRTITHALGSVPACILVKNTTSAQDWYVYHRSLGGGTNPYFLILNSTAAQDTGGGIWGDPAAWTSATFTTRNGNSNLNGSGQTYVAYLFAHDAGGFGTSGSDNVISCGSFTTDGSGNATVSLGYEPQWLLVKNATTASNNEWRMVDNMRGFPVNDASSSLLIANSSAAETTTGTINLLNTGFQIDGLANSATCIYIAIRRGPMKTPTSGTSVYEALTYAGDGSAGTGQTLTTAFPMDFAFTRYNRSSTGVWDAISRLQDLSTTANASRYLNPHNTNAEATGGFLWQTSQTQLKMYGFSTSTTELNYFFRRAPGFFDVVCYTGTGASATLNHNLGVAPNMVIIKGRSVVSNWETYLSSLGGTSGNGLALNDPGAKTGTPPVSSATATTFTLNNGVSTSSGQTYVAYLFATLTGVSKVGSYTGTGTTKQIDCGFTGGARFVLIKRTDSTGDWYVWDSARGIVAGNDPYLLLNSTAAEVTGTDYVDTYAAGFEISSTAPAAINANGGSFIFLAIS